MADETGFNYLNLAYIDDFIKQREDFTNRYNKIAEDFKNITEKLLENWAGEGADAFRADAQNVGTNLTGIGEMLGLMCDTLSDCGEVFTQVDKAIGEMNKAGK